MNLGAAFVASAEKFCGKPAVFWGENEYSYERILEQAIGVARHLQEQGLQPGDRAAIWLKNCPEFIPSLFGIFLAGGVAVPINNFLKGYEVSYILQDAGAKFLFSEAAMSGQFPELQMPGLKFFLIDDLHKTNVAPAADFGPVPREESDLAVIIYTSGTTGRPKGAMLSHGNLLHNVESCRESLEAVSEDRFVLLLPMFHSFMLTVSVLLPLVSGATIILIRSLHPPKNIIQEICQRQGTLLPAIPQFFRTLASLPIPIQLPIRLFVSGAAPLPVEVIKEFNGKFPVPLLEGYGLSEASPVVTMNPIRGVCKPGSIGLPLPRVEVTIQDESGNLLGPGETGEICVRGGNVMQGYWNLPEETQKSFRNGWLLTGDMGHKDTDGYIYVTDRKKDMLLVNGINVYPREIEEILYQFAGIKEAAVIGVPDARKGELPVAFIAPNEGTALDEKLILQFVRSKLADYKVPRKIVFLPALPRNATGKILKTALREIPVV